MRQPLHLLLLLAASVATVVVLDTPDHIVKRKVLMTIVAGRVVYDGRTAKPPR